MGFHAGRAAAHNSSVVAQQTDGAQTADGTPTTTAKYGPPAGQAQGGGRREVRAASRQAGQRHNPPAAGSERGDQTYTDARAAGVVRSVALVSMEGIDCEALII